ncbi:MAG: nucleotide exchange factor GrpE [Verrucomicrobiae bacterium]|nr:nucleotide exchange factor GrpE [Verrucomicrobiae bacterium]MDW8308612.1 nucleotide exchange factor GrpE [Verrucomicrobiales bacterium]
MKQADAKTEVSSAGANAPGSGTGSDAAPAPTACATSPETQNQAATPEPVLPVSPSTLTEEQLEELKQRAAKADEYWDKLLRTAADFDNYKKRVARERQETLQFANAALLQKLLPVLDNLEMALAACPDARTVDAQSGPQRNLNALQSGVAMIQQQLRSVLAEAGLEEIDASAQPFDPRWHEAVAEEETAAVPEGHVVRQVRKGYRLRDRLLRPAAVVVAKKPAPTSSQTS